MMNQEEGILLVVIIKFKTAMIKSSLCDYTNVFILVKGTITITGSGDDAAATRADERNKDLIFRNGKINDMEVKQLQQLK